MAECDAQELRQTDWARLERHFRLLDEWSSSSSVTSTTRINDDENTMFELRTNLVRRAACLRTLSRAIGLA